MRRFVAHLGLRTWKVGSRSAVLRALLCGMLPGVYLVTLFGQLTAAFGTSLVIVTGLSIGAALGLELGRTKESREDGALSARDKLLRVFAWTHFALACWVVLHPWLIGWVIAVVSAVAPDPLTWPRTGQFLIGVAVAGLSCAAVVGVVRLMTAGASLFSRPRWGRVPSRASLQGAFLLGVVTGMLAAVFQLAPAIGIQYAGLSAAMISVCISGVCIYRAVRESRAPAGKPVERRSPVSGIAEDVEPSRSTEKFTNLLTAVCLGASVAAVLRMLHQLFPVSGFLVYVEWAAVIGGVALGRYGVNRWRQRAASQAGERSEFLPLGAMLFTAAWAVCFLAAFSLYTDLTLLLNASVAQVWLQMSLRSLLVAAVLLPLAIGWAAAMFFSTAHIPGISENPRDVGLPRLPFALFAGGFLAARWFLLTLWGPALLLVLVAWLLVLWAAAGAFRRGVFPRSRAGQVAAGAAILLVLAGPRFREAYDPARTAKLLFATNVFVAHQQGVDSELLMHLDDGRLVGTTEGTRATYTLWKHEGTKYQLRENGMPVGVVSADVAIAPEFSTEAMQAIMPLVLHESPRKVLVLGLGSGVPVTAGLQFPLEQLTCVEADGRLIELIRERIWKPFRPEANGDDRLRFVKCDPVLAVALDRREYDVIISSPAQGMLLEAAPCYTAEFYRRAAARLGEEGIFCQRFQQVDFGPRPLQSVARTMQTAFENVVALESGAAELLLLGTNSPQGIVREGLVERLQLPHVRRSLATLGWDWTVPLNLAAFKQDTLQEFSTDARINTAANSLLAFRLPQEVMRWGPKQQELNSALAQRTARFLDWESVDETDGVLLTRLKEVVTQREHMAAYPDQFWSYRKPLKQRLSLKPRTKIVQVKGEEPRREIHPEDRRRLGYFAALDNAARLKQPLIHDVSRIAEFTDPYDPLVSYFLHREMAELYARSAEGAPERELAHRLHTVHYALPQDRSVRNVAATLELLADHPEIAEPQQRWDHLNALCQTLWRRWEVRGAVKPKSSRIVLNDIEKSLSAFEKALEAMDALQPEVGVSPESWQRRKEWLEISFQRPLRSYRKRLHQYYLKQKEQTEKLLQQAIEGEETEEPDT